MTTTVAVPRPVVSPAISCSAISRGIPSVVGSRAEHAGQAEKCTQTGRESPAVVDEEDMPMRPPLPRFRRACAVFLLLGVVATVAGCSTPHTGGGTLDEGRQRVAGLVLEAAHALPATVTFAPPTEVGEQPCRKTVAGYVIGKTGA